MAETGWTRVSRGSHAGHIPLGAERRGGAGPLRESRSAAGLRAGRVRHFPLLPGRDLRERTSTAEGLRLIPLETHDRRAYGRATRASPRPGASMHTSSPRAASHERRVRPAPVRMYLGTMVGS